MVIFLTNFPDNKIPWAPWMANARHYHGPHMRWHCWDQWGLAVCCFVGAHVLPSTNVHVGLTRRPRQQNPMSPWIANEGHYHGPHMGCQWWGPWGLATRCHAGPMYLPLLMPIWPNMGPMYVCNHPANSMGTVRDLCVCLLKHPHHRWSQGSPQTECSGKAR